MTETKPNQNPIEFPQDVFNIIKDYMDVVDVPTPMWNDMMKASIKDIASNQSAGSKSLEYFKPYPRSVIQRKIPIALRKRRYWVGDLKQAKYLSKDYLQFCKETYGVDTPKFREKMLYMKQNIKCQYPQFWDNFRFEATDYTWITLAKLYLLRDNRSIGGVEFSSFCKCLGKRKRGFPNLY